MATDERTPEEQAVTDASDRRIQTAIEQAVEDYASYVVADWFDLDGETCERWVDAMYDHLRDALDPEDLIRALLISLEPLVEDRARELVRQVRDLPCTTDRKDRSS